MPRLVILVMCSVLCS